MVLEDQTIESPSIALLGTRDETLVRVRVGGTWLTKHLD